MRAQLLAQLNAVLQTQDTARGLIVNMSDVLFDTGKYTLKQPTQVKLAKISGILLAHPGLTLQIEGRTDSVGSAEMNQRLSEQRADAVRDFLASQGVPVSSMIHDELDPAILLPAFCRRVIGCDRICFTEALRGTELRSGNAAPGTPVQRQ